MENLVKELLLQIGETPDRQGLVRTPERVAKVYQFLTQGYDANPKEIISRGLLEAKTEEMVVVHDIDFFSLCEHHLLPFFGQAHVAYLPQGRILGLSKIPRVVEIFSRRLQVQERLTEEIAYTLQEFLNPRGVAVVLNASHLCMRMRGIQKINAIATTSCVLGAFREDPSTRAEFMNLIHSTK